MFFHFVSEEGCRAKCLSFFSPCHFVQIVSLSVLNSGHDAVLCLWEDKVKECSGAERQRETLEPVGMVCSRGTSRKMLGKERSGSFVKERCLLKILSARHLKSFTLGENGELTYGSQFNFITVPSRGRWKNKM